MSKRKSNDEFIGEAQLIHHNRYDYSKLEYVNNKTKVCIICPDHGEFWQIPSDHLNGKGCPLCKNRKIGDVLRDTVEDFTKKSNEIHEITNCLKVLSPQQRNREIDIYD